MAACDDVLDNAGCVPRFERHATLLRLWKIGIGHNPDTCGPVYAGVRRLPPPGEALVLGYVHPNGRHHLVLNEDVFACICHDRALGCALAYAVRNCAICMHATLNTGLIADIVGPATCVIAVLCPTEDGHDEIEYYTDEVHLASLPYLDSLTDASA